VEFTVDTNGTPEELERRLRSGDQAALLELFSQYQERLWRMVRFRMDRRLLGRVDPDDVLQEAYLTLAKRLKDFNGDLSVCPLVWLRTMVMQTLTDLHRHHLGTHMRDAGREIAQQGCRYPQTTSVSLAAQFVAHMTSPSQAAVRAEVYGRVEQAIAEMDPIDREVLALRHFEELGNSEVAEVLGIQQKAASIRYVRALKRLKAILSKMPGIIEDSRYA
jgi:RNA polymerase sigma-70 factor (ECF subfamily)